VKAPTFETDDGMHHVTGFHWRDGWFFQRQEEGSVRVFHVSPPHVAPEPPDTDVDFTVEPNSWASIVASVSVAGEHGGRFYRAHEFHMNPPVHISMVPPR
jgi:hypothetical protein